MTRGSPKPMHLAAVDGSSLNHPERYASKNDRINDDLKIGPPSPWIIINDRYLRLWLWMVGVGTWLTEADRINMEVCCRMTIESEDYPADTKVAMTLLRLLKELGMTPLSRGRTSSGRTMSKPGGWKP